jgi:hypothetical protein
LLDAKKKSAVERLTIKKLYQCSLMQLFFFLFVSLKHKIKEKHRNITEEKDYVTFNKYVSLFFI